jgi:methylase of polypeptide subunit release factors
MAAKLGAKKTIGIDISPYSIQTAKNNAQLNGLDNNKIEFIESDYFSNVPEIRFDKIYSNPPCMPLIEECLLVNENYKVSVDGGSDGAFFYKKVIEESLRYLKKEGELMIPVPKWCNWKSVISLLEKYYTYEIVYEEPVRYFLIDQDVRLKKHIEDLYRDNIVDIHTDNDIIYSDILICKCTTKR